MSDFFGTYIFVPVVDGVIIKKRPTELLRDGRVNGASSWAYLETTLTQEALLAITNTVEGTLFVDSTTALSVHIPECLVNLFPRFDKPQVKAASKVYASIGAPTDQAIAIMGESIFVCPTYFLLLAFKGRGFKVLHTFFSSHGTEDELQLHGEFAIPPGGHAQDVIYYFPSSVLAPGVLPPYNNTTFINYFSQSFLNFALAMDPNVKWDPENSVPRWSRWGDGGAEVLFNKTDAGDPVFRSIETSEALLRRCNFWESVSALSAQ
ncbi:hypothetical protein AN958_06369 [Leucoagaricus sp. SymC.cos]|nr:hypothetical protein AN958_06369 [Leucoagaricus sp. SymC.cos]